MTDAVTPAPPRKRRERRYCGRPKRQGEGTCTRPAGWGTDHQGYGACKLHGGSTPNGRKNAQTAAATELMAKVLHNADATPITDPVAALQRLAAIVSNGVDVMGDWVNQLERNAATGTEIRAEVQVWERLIGQSRGLLVDMAKLGIANRQVAIEEGQALLFAAALRWLLSQPVAWPAEAHVLVGEMLGRLDRGEITVGDESKGRRA